MLVDQSELPEEYHSREPRRRTDGWLIAGMWAASAVAAFAAVRAAWGWVEALMAWMGVL